MATDYLSRFLAGQGLGGTPVEDDGALVRRFLASRGRIRPEDEAADTAEVQRQLAARALAPPADLAALDVPPPRVEKTSPAAAAPTEGEADYNARRAAASRTALVNDVLSGATEGFDRATEWIAGRGPGVRARDRGAVEDAERRFLGQEAEREKRALAERNRPMVEAERAAALEKAKAETERAKASAASTTADAAYEAALRDVNSPETQAMRAQAVAMSKGMLTPELAANMNGLQIRDALKTATSQLNAEAMAGLARTRIEQSAESAASDRAIRIAALEQAERLAALSREQAYELAQLRLEEEREKRRVEEARKAEAAGVAEQGKIDADTAKLSKEFDDSGGPGFYSKYAEAKSILEKYKRDIPGFGKVDGRVPDMFVSGDALAMRQAVGQMLAEYRKGITGAGMSNAERVEYGQITGLLKSNNERSVRQGVERLKSSMDSRIRAVAGGYRPGAVSQYAARVPQFREALAGTGLVDGASGGVAPSGTMVDVDDLPAGTNAPTARAPEAPPRPVTKPTIAPGEEVPRLISTKGLKPGQLKDMLEEGEAVRIPWKFDDGTAGYRTVRKVTKDGKTKLVVTKEEK